MKRNIYYLVTNYSVFLTACSSPAKNFNEAGMIDGFDISLNTSILAFGTFLDAYDNHISLASVMILMIVLGAFYIKAMKHKQEKALEAYLAESRISKKIHDEVANELYGTINQIERFETITGQDKEKLLEHLTSIYHCTRNISRETALINTGDQYVNQLKTMIAAYITTDINVIIKGIDKVEWQKINTVQKITLYRVLQELMTNMKKHSGATVIILEFNYQNKQLTVKYKDNGIGVPNDKIVKNGLQNVENRMESLGGTAIFENSSGKGFNLTISFPAHDLYV